MSTKIPKQKIVASERQREQPTIEAYEHRESGESSAARASARESKNNYCERAVEYKSAYISPTADSLKRANEACGRAQRTKAKQSRAEQTAATTTA